jgi:Flp pilus assembly protein TadG
MALFILLLVLLGMVDTVQIMMTRYTVAQAVRAAAHQAALIGGPDGTNGALSTTKDGRAKGTIADTARLIFDSGMATDSSKATIHVTCGSSPCRRYNPITVRIQYQDTLWVPIPMFTDVHADLSATRAAEKDGQ